METIFSLNTVDGGRTPELESTPELGEDNLCLKSIFSALKSPNEAVRIKAVEDLDRAGYAPTKDPKDFVWVCPGSGCEVEVHAYDGTPESLSKGVSIDNPALDNCIQS